MQNNVLYAKKIARTLHSLPAPTAVYSSPKVEFAVYRAKDLYRSRWNNTVLKTLTSFCREAYGRYGDRPLFDGYDKKSAIYLVRAKYQTASGTVNEWLSIRMVPGDKDPLGVGEPEIYIRKGKTLDYWIRRQLGSGGFWRHVISSSRMCSIPPYILLKNGNVRFVAAIPRRATGISFALIHKQFLEDYPLQRFPYHYITAMIRSDLRRRALGQKGSGGNVYPMFTPAHKFLGIGKDEVKVRRDVYSYAFPLYWFDTQKLLRLVNVLRRNDGKPPISALSREMFTALTRTSTRPEMIAGLRIVPERMRQLIDSFVPDAPELKITTAGRWYKGMDAVIRTARVSKIQ